jgi:hypothetical protein
MQCLNSASLPERNFLNAYPRPGGMRSSISAQLVTEPCNLVNRPRNVHSKRHTLVGARRCI